MVHTGKRDIDEFQSTALTQNICGHGHVGKDHGIGISGFLDQFLRIGRFGIDSKNMTFCFKGRFARSELFV